MQFAVPVRDYSPLPGGFACAVRPLLDELPDDELPEELPDELPDDELPVDLPDEVASLEVEPMPLNMSDEDPPEDPRV